MGKKSEVTFSPAVAVATGEVRFSVELKDWDAEGDRSNSLALFGWCVSTSGKPLAVELYLHGTPVASSYLHVERPDVVKALARPEAPLSCGFHMRLSKLLLPRGAILEVQLWVERESGGSARVPLGTLSGLPTADAMTQYAERYQPLLLLGMGRSGTSYLMRLLAAHSEILVPGPHPYEMRQPVWFWQAAHVLSSPASVTSASSEGFEANDADWLGYNPYRSRDWEKIAGAPIAMQWQEEVLPISCIDFCKRQVDEFVARYSVGRSGPPRYIAQKMLISPARYLVRNIYQDAREIFLVRDFRDVWLSARSINRRRGLASFERSKFPNDLEWLRGLAFSSRQIRLAHTATGPQAQLIKFEDLMRDPHSTLSHMLSQLGVDGSPARVGAMISEANSTELTTHNLTGRPSQTSTAVAGGRR
jgi:hypothetical protein